MTVSNPTAIFLLSLLGVPLTYLVNSASVLHGPAGLFVSGVGALVLMVTLTYLVVSRKDRPTDKLFYVFILGTFSSVVDLIIALENDGIIHGFMTQYLKDGEPYLRTAHGTMICYWDGIAHYAMYLMMLSALAWDQSYREVGLYWAGSIGFSMLVLIPGAVIGSFHLRYSFLLNVPYMIIPFSSGGRFLMERKNENLSLQSATHNHVSILKRPVDIMLLLGIIISAIFALLRGIAVLTDKYEVLNGYVKNIEPYLNDPSAFPKAQMLVYLFYFLPYYCMVVYGLLWPGNTWMPDWALIHAGAAAQGQFSHIGSSLHKRTPFILRVPRDPMIRSVFWAINTFLLVLPQVLAYRCIAAPEFFQRRPKIQERQTGYPKKNS